MYPPVSSLAHKQHFIKIGILMTQNCDETLQKKNEIVVINTHIPNLAPQLNTDIPADEKRLKPTHTNNKKIKDKI